MSELSEILAYNQNFVESGEYEKYFTDKYPAANWPSCPAWTRASSNCCPTRSD